MWQKYGWGLGKQPDTPCASVLMVGPVCETETEVEVEVEVEIAAEECEEYREDFGAGRHGSCRGNSSGYSENPMMSHPDCGYRSRFPFEGVKKPLEWVHCQRADSLKEGPVDIW